MEKLRLIIIVLFIGTNYYHCPIDGQFCQTHIDFVNWCKTVYQGVANGGRCFYRSNVRTSWQNAWALCAVQNGTLAQIHTDNEMTNISANIQNGFWANIWLAMVRNANAPHPLPNSLNATFWYDSANAPNLILSAGNTWVRKRQSDDTYSLPDQNCFDIFSGLVCDDDCTNNTFAALCVVSSMSNQLQSFAYIPNICMNETVIEEFPTCGSSEECAQHCRNYSVWCRSYNYYPQTQICDLFSWYYLDTPNILNNIQGCYHYAYVP